MAWVAVVRCSERIEAKIHEKHQVTLAEAREAALFSSSAVQRWANPADGKGPRLMVRNTSASGRELLVVLFQLDDDGAWALATAYPV